MVPVPGAGGVCTRSKKVKVLDGVSMTLARGVCHGLLGHNGAGKSTLLDVLMGSAHATGGTGHVFGAPLGSRAARSAMGVCPQTDVVIPSLTGREHLRLWARFRGVPRLAMDGYIATMLATVSLSDKADATLATFSGGMRRRLSILSAVIGSPDLVVLDEVSNGLDPVQRRHVWEIVASLKS
ncbi:P-loop containing nucleoside triphosphate hydrolase protein, partial [Catenaria anguillulae PL171]